MPHGGSNMFLCGRSVGTSFDSKTWLSLDPCGLLGVACSWGVHFYALIVVSTKLLSNSPMAMLIFFFLYIPASLLAMASLFKAWTTDPGAVPLGARPLTVVRHAASSDSLGRSGHSNPDPLAAPQQPPARAVSRCHKCNDNFKPPRAHHDSVTGRCIVKFDHFCPWVGNAVGALNHKFFCLFLLYTGITCILSLLLLLLRTIHCGYTITDPESFNRQQYGNGGQKEGGRYLAFERRMEDGSSVYKYPECNTFYSSHFVLGLLICSLVFLVFTCTMGCEQFEAIETGKGKIARMKMRVGNSGTEFQRVTEEFNEMFGGDSPQVSLHWFLPQDVKFPRGMKKVVLGYEWDESFDPEPYEPATLNVDGGSSLGDQEMSELEGGNRSGGVIVSTQDVLLKQEPASMSDVSSVGSDSGIKNRKSPPKPPEIS